MKESEITMIYPCPGNNKIGTEQGHLHAYKSKTGPWVTKETARELCPRRINLLTSGEYVLCPICKSYQDGKLEIDLL